jgi:hypothetical protein
MSNMTSFDLRYEVELVPQQTGMSCWAAGAAMVVGWRDRQCLPAGAIAEATGYWAQYQNGLAPEDTTMFATWGLEAENPVCYTVEGFYGLLDAYGPLWVAGAVPGPHVRVVTGMWGDGGEDDTFVAVNDPWEEGMTAFRPDNTGSVYTLTFRQLMEQVETLGSQELGLQAPLYVAHSSADAAAQAKGL